MVTSTNPPTTLSSSDEENIFQPLEHQKSLERKLVQWEEGDKANPLNWTTAYKSWITFQLGMLALAASAGSSITSPVRTTPF